ncbi:HTTM domain-containing protein [Galbibacter pacificus]|uniref:HTTM domain-containing protein n=1 Tax=Galbibacter pacificus TaxID=2996052 RepID=A0ABT6FT18_9FLAO|nr:HTTM domain-containing protein [Galbibacter pacificus]MDG3582470.1 HTTM domain-containing protein [Galbibacter pacificus]MDG3586412.1 HTTM domain-containing protein [Galbibacter pacificus]
MLNKFLFTRVDNSPLVVFRVIFGLLIFLEATGAIFTGWVKKTLVDPKFTFNFIGLDFLQPLPGNGMYFYYAVMGIFGLLVMLGYKYRFSMGAYTVMWAGVYFMQKSSYNNHYYLLLLLCFIMFLLPASRYFSLDAKYNPSYKKISMPRWCTLIVILQVWIVYIYAAVAKLYPDWLDLSVVKMLMVPREHYFLIGGLLQQKWAHIVITYSGILFDLLIVPLLLCRTTRKWAFIASIFFHLFNSFVFHIGIFPYMSMAFALFFFEAETIRSLFLKKKKLYTDHEVIIPNYKKPLLIFGSIYFMVQIALPLRHWFIKDNVLWTEEGHRLSWRMMLRGKSGMISFQVLNHTTGNRYKVNLDDYLSSKQRQRIATKPDMIWQFAQYLKKEYAKKGDSISVYVSTSKVSVNRGPWQDFVKPDIDIANKPWHYFKHEDWIYPYKQDSIKD